MLETKQVDCVIIVGMDDEFPAVRIIRKKEDIKRGMQSKYGYVPLGVVWTY